MKKTLIFLLVIWGVFAEDVKFYNNYKVYRMNPLSRAHSDLLLNLSKRNDLDFWTDPRRIGFPVDVMVKPEDQEMFIKGMRNNEMHPEVMIEDVQKLIDAQKIGDYKNTREMTWTSYYPLEDIYNWMDDIAITYPSNVTIFNGGTSSEGRPIKGIRINPNSGKRIIVIESGIHAREWITPAWVTWLINEILTTTDPTFRKIADSFEWQLFPSVNPDGYVYSHTNNRLWRKTRTQYESCYGADPNRNWDIHWMEQGTLDDPCTEIYGGPSPFSEMETRTLSSYLTLIGGRIDVYLSFHSYSQLLLLPYGYTSQHLDNYEEMMQIGKKATEALSRRYGTFYEFGSVAEMIYPASGTSLDWVKQKLKVNVVACYELRDTGRYGFLLPADQIIPNNLEVLDSLISMIEEAEKFGYVTIG